MGTYKLVHGNHGNEMFSTIAELWKDQKYCDCALIVDCSRVQVISGYHLSLYALETRKWVIWLTVMTQMKSVCCCISSGSALFLRLEQPS